MKRKLVIYLSLLIVFSLSACGQSTPASEANAPVSPVVEQAETTSPQEPQLPEAAEAPEKEEAPAEPDKEASQEQEVSTEQSDDNDQPEEKKTENTADEAPADQTNSDVDPGDSEQSAVTKEVEETVLTQKDYYIILTENLILDVPAGTEVSPEYLEYLEDMSGAIAFIPSADEFAGETETPPVEEGPEEIYTPPAPPAKLTDEEVHAFVNDYLDNFKANTDMSDWSDDAIAKLDENIEIVRNETPKGIARALKDYQDGNTSKDMAEFYIFDFLVNGGYGDQEITVQ